MIVVDTNILLYLCLRKEHIEPVNDLMRNEPVWCAPFLWRSEMRNVLTGYIRRGEVALQHAMAMQEETEELLQGNEHHIDSRDILELAHTSGCTAYDCEFVALAKELGIPLVTMDRQILQAFPDIAVPLVA